MVSVVLSGAQWDAAGPGLPSVAQGRTILELTGQQQAQAMAINPTPRIVAEFKPIRNQG